MTSIKRASWVLTTVAVIFTLLAIAVGVYLYLQDKEGLQLTTLIATIILAPMWTFVYKFMMKAYSPEEKT